MLLAAERKQSKAEVEAEAERERRRAARSIKKEGRARATRLDHACHVIVLGRFRCVAWVKCPYRVAGKASALRAGKRAPG